MRKFLIKIVTLRLIFLFFVKERRLFFSLFQSGSRSSQYCHKLRKKCLFFIITKIYCGLNLGIYRFTLLWWNWLVKAERKRVSTALQSIRLEEITCKFSIFNYCGQNWISLQSNLFSFLCKVQNFKMKVVENLCS